ncbi:hypothetical protein ACFL27_20870, partial [candidate division CSSED10-310 bacterium]
IIGSDQIFILEVFNASSECIKNSQENVKSFINYVASLRKLFQNKLARSRLYQKLLQADPVLWDIETMGFFIKPHAREYYLSGGVGFDLLKFYHYDEQALYKYRILATMKENQEIWINSKP